MNAKAPAKRLIFIVILLTIFSAFVLLFVFSKSSTDTEKIKVIRFVHIGPIADARHKAALKFKELVETDANGRIKVQIYYGGQLGGDRDAIEGIRLGTVQMTVSGAGIFSNFEPKMGVTALPFLFESFEQAWAFNDSNINDRVSQLLLKQGIRVLAYWENGFRCITNSVRPVNIPEDLRGLKIRTPENPIIIAAMKALGANASPLPWPEVYMALQQKAFDGQENPIPIIYVHKLYEVQKYLAVTNHVYETMPLVISERFFKSLTEDQKKIVCSAAKKSQDYNRELIKEQTEQMLGELEKKGMIISHPKLPPFREATKTVREKFTDKFSKKLIEDIYNYGKNRHKS